MIAIPNMEKPKSCGECEFNYNLEGGSYEWCECVILHDDINQFDTRRTDCPLIEIIRCGECKYWHNHEWSSTCDKNIGNGFPSDYFCADGERRADEDI